MLMKVTGCYLYIYILYEGWWVHIAMSSLSFVYWSCMLLVASGVSVMYVLCWLAITAGSLTALYSLDACLREWFIDIWYCILYDNLVYYSIGWSKPVMLACYLFYLLVDIPMYPLDDFTLGSDVLVCLTCRASFWTPSLIFIIYLS